jgi:hypothetical protein
MSSHPERAAHVESAVSDRTLSPMATAAPVLPPTAGAQHYKLIYRSIIITNFKHL